MERSSQWLEGMMAGLIEHCAIVQDVRRIAAAVAASVFLCLRNDRADRAAIIGMTVDETCTC
jgi:hypothetical protein